MSAACTAPTERFQPFTNPQPLLKMMQRLLLASTLVVAATAKTYIFNAAKCNTYVRVSATCVRLPFGAWTVPLSRFRRTGQLSDVFKWNS
jgi:hypothetical protein